MCDMIGIFQEAWDKGGDGRIFPDHVTHCCRITLKLKILLNF